MDLTKLPQELIFFHKESIEDYDIDDPSSCDGILYDYLIDYSISVPYGWNKEKTILTMFNDANYLATMIILDERFFLHTDLWIDYYNRQWHDDTIVSFIFEMVNYYLSNTTNLPNHVRKAVYALMNDYDEMCTSDSGTEMEICLTLTKEPKQKLTCDHFKIQDISPRLLKYKTFKGKVNWRPITNDFEISDIIQITKIIGKDVQGQRLVLQDIYKDCCSSENLDKRGKEYHEVMQILVSHMNSKGELYNKRQLIEAYKKQEELDEEIFNLEMESISTHNYEEKKKQYESTIATLREEIVDLQKEVANLESYKSVNENLEKAVSDLQTRLKEKEQEQAFNARTGESCFTNTQMGILMYAVGMLTEEKIPGKTTLGEVVQNISGYKATTVNQNMKGAFREGDIEAVVKAIESKFPKLAEKVRKQ